MPETDTRTTHDTTRGTAPHQLGGGGGGTGVARDAGGTGRGGDARAAGRPALAADHRPPQRRAQHEVAATLRRLAALIGGGLPTGRALAIAARQAGDAQLAGALRAACHAGARGGLLADQLDRHPELFSPLHTAIVRAGEYAGARHRALADAAELLDRELARHDRIRVGVTQPLAAFAAVVMVVTIAASALAPGFDHAYTGLDALPLPTRALLAAVEAAGDIGIPLLASMLPAALVVRRWLRGDDGRAHADTVRLRLPVVGPLARAAAMAHAARAAAALVRANMPQDQALGLVAADAANARISAGLRDAQATAAAGGSPARTLRAHGLLGPEAAGALAAGERAGPLDAAYTDLADRLDAEVDALLRTLAARLGPVLVALVVLVVTAILVALYLPVAWLLA